jgi:predicted Zn-dependent protease
MKVVIVNEEQNVIDLVIDQYGNAESVVTFCLQNNIDINAYMTPGDRMLIDETIAYRTTGFISSSVKQDLKQEVVVILENQNLIDVALQEYGSVEALTKLCVDNAFSMDSALTPGSKLKINSSFIVNKQLVSYLKKSRIKIGTEENEETPTGIGSMAIGINFIIG